MEEMLKRVTTVLVLLIALLPIVGCGKDETAPPAQESADMSNGEPSDAWEQWYEANKADIEALTAALKSRPAWARVSLEQVHTARKHGVPVAFENDLGMRFVLIPAGTFVMGRLPGLHARSGTWDLGEVQREVTLTRPAYVQITETTNAVFRRFRADHNADAWKTEAGEGDSTRTLNRDRQPATGVSWNDAKAFSAWLSKRANVRNYRLPSDAEWEYACKAGTTTTYSVGQDLMHHQASFKPESATDLGGAPGSVDVGSFHANPWGLYDMHGNVSEWCADWFDLLSSERAVDPTGPLKGTVKVVRGGGAGTSAVYCGSAVRQFAHVEFKSNGLASMMTGFRLVSPLPENTD